MKLKLVFSLLLIVVLSSFHSEKSLINYFGQIPPDKTPKIFAPQFICLDNRFESRGAFSPDGKAFYFTVVNSNFTSQKIFYTEFKKGKWSAPDTASFSKKFNNHEPFFSYDGKKLYFSSDRNKDTLQNRKDLFVTGRHNGTWSEPIKLMGPINSAYNELFFNQS
jgi:Tol biopolymer transport system component